MKYWALQEKKGDVGSREDKGKLCWLRSLGGKTARLCVVGAEQRVEGDTSLCDVSRVLHLKTYTVLAHRGCLFSMRQCEFSCPILPELKQAKQFLNALRCKRDEKRF